jgi:hypothetical protein
MLISISEVLGDAFCEGVEWAAKEDVIGGVWHDLHLEINVNVIKGEVDIAETAMCFGDDGVGSLHLQCSFYLQIVTKFLPYYIIYHHYLTAGVQDAFYYEFAFNKREDQAEGDRVTAYSKVIGAIGVVYCTPAVYC